VAGAAAAAIAAGMSRQAFAAIPPRSEWANLALLTFTFAAWFGICYGGAAALVQFIPWRVPIELPLDAAMPLLPAASALYLTILPMMLLAPFVLRDQASLLPLFCAFMLETTVAAVIFLILPIDDVPVACATDSPGCAIFRFADTLNLHHNNLPSLHVAFAWTLALAFATRTSWFGLVVLYGWASAVSLSTELTHQHFVMDVIAGSALAIVCWRVASAWARRPEVVATFDVELLALRNMGRFARRHRRYLVIAIAILASGIPHWRRRRLARLGFAFLQAMDDLLDGDRPSEREPADIADEMLGSLESGGFEHHELARLGAGFRAELLARGGQEALDTARALIRAMRNDRQRVIARATSTREQLRGIHRATFAGSVDLMMLAAGSPLRHGQVPCFIDALGWCSAIRDLGEDLGHGLINLPGEVFEAARVEKPGVALPVLLETRAVTEWLEQERVRGRALLDSVDAELVKLGGIRGAKLLACFARSMRKFA
jgi:membrane-associated phospholipid phosphatase